MSWDQCGPANLLLCPVKPLTICIFFNGWDLHEQTCCIMTMTQVFVSQKTDIKFHDKTI